MATSTANRGGGVSWTLWPNDCWQIWRPTDGCNALLQNVKLPQTSLGETRSVDLFRAATSAPPPRVDPLVIDLDGDGIETTSAAQDVAFDFDGDGFAEGIAWVRPDDGLLVLGRNGYGAIDDGSELFGDVTPLADVPPGPAGRSISATACSKGTASGGRDFAAS